MTQPIKHNALSQLQADSAMASALLADVLLQLSGDELILDADGLDELAIVAEAATRKMCDLVEFVQALAAVQRGAVILVSSRLH